MAITKIIGAIHPPKRGGRYKVLNNVINYITKAEKTADGLYVGTSNCLSETALREMIQTKEMYGKTSSVPSERLGYHLTIAFSKEEKVTPEKALQVMKDFTEEFLKSEYEAVYSVHVDKEHIHGHLCFNSVNIQTGKKFRYEDGDWAKLIQPVTDRVCERHGLNTLAMDTGMSPEEYEKERKRKKHQSFREKSQKSHSNNKYHKDSAEKYSWNEHLRTLIDAAVLKSESFEGFEEFLKQQGVQIRKGNSEKFGPYIKLKAPGMEIFRKTYQLGKDYTVEHLKERISIKDKPLPEYKLPEGVVLTIPIHYFVRMKRVPLSATMKRYYARLYRLGIQPDYPKKITFQDRKASILKAEQQEEQWKIVLKYGISSKEDAENAVTQSKLELQQAEALKQEFIQKHAPYSLMLRSYKTAEKLKGKYKLYSEGYQEFEKEAENYLRLKKIYSRYGFSEEKIKQYSEDYVNEQKEIAVRQKEAVKQFEAAKAVFCEFTSEEEGFTDEMEQFYQSVPEQEKKEEEEEKRKEWAKRKRNTI